MKRNKFMTVIISVILLLSVSGRVEGKVSQSILDQMLLHRILHVTEMKEESVCNVEYIKDFAENLYVIIEFDPCGYAIAHKESNVIIEYNLYSRSPFSDCAGEPFYGGPSYYYEKINGGYRHTVLKESLGENNIPN